MMTTEHSPKTPHGTGIFAMLRAFLGIQGTGAPLSPRVFSLISLTLFVLLLAAAPASAEFSRPYITQITGAQSEGKLVPFTKLTGGLAIDPATGNVYVGIPGSVDEFNSSNAFLEEIAGPNAERLAYDDTPPQKLIATSLHEPVAVDNTTSPFTGGDVYLAPGSINGTSVRRVTASGQPADFTCTAQGASGYIKGNELTGIQAGQSFAEGTSASGQINSIAVDSGSGESEGDIYVTNIGDGEGYPPQVDQFNSAGCFLGAFTQAGTPLAPLNRDLGGVAVDPKTGDVLVEEDQQQVIDEFTSKGDYLGRVAGIAKNDPFGENSFNAVHDGIAVSPGGDLYVEVCDTSDAQACEQWAVDEFGEGAFYPIVVTGQVSGVQPAAATLEGVVRGQENPNKEALEMVECEVRIRAEEDFSSRAAKAGFTRPRSLRACSNRGRVRWGRRLKKRTTRCMAKRRTWKRARSTTTAWSRRAEARTAVRRSAKSQSFAAPAAPAVEAVSVGDVSSSFADFSAKIDPRGSDTTYQFQYVDAARYEAALAAGAADPYAGGGSVPVPAGDHRRGRSLCERGRAGGRSVAGDAHMTIGWSRRMAPGEAKRARRRSRPCRKVCGDCRTVVRMSW